MRYPISAYKHIFVTRRYWQETFQIYFIISNISVYSNSLHRGFKRAVGKGGCQKDGSICPGMPDAARHIFTFLNKPPMSSGPCPTHYKAIYLLPQTRTLKQALLSTTTESTHHPFSLPKHIRQGRDKIAGGGSVIGQLEEVEEGGTGSSLFRRYCSSQQLSSEDVLTGLASRRAALGGSSVASRILGCRCVTDTWRRCGAASAASALRVVGSTTMTTTGGRQELQKTQCPWSICFFQQKCGATR